MKDKLEQKFRELEGRFDTEEPRLGHFDRFEVKLARQTVKQPKWNPNTWKWLAIAASIVLVFTLGFGNFSTKQDFELADVSPKMEETQSFFVSTIQHEIENINLKRNPDNQQIIDDAFKQLKKLETKYVELTSECYKSNKDKRIIYAMISNFQQRIEVLQTLLQQIDELEQIKNNFTDEKII